MIRCGIIGFGRIGREHSQWIAKSSAAEVGVVFDPTEARREIARSLKLSCASSMESMLADASIDAVLVSTPTSMHYDHATAALQAGKHVMIEKPMTLDLAQAQTLVELAESQGRVLSVFHNRRWDCDFLTVKQAIESGKLGRVFNVESRLGQWASCVGPAAREWNPDWRNQAAFGGGGLYDWGSHFVDQLWQLMLPARPVRVFAQLRGNVWSRDCDDLARVCIDFDNGATGLLEINTTTTCPLPRWHVDGTSGSAESPFSPDFDTRTWAQLTFRCPDGTSRLSPIVPPAMTEVSLWKQFARACTTGEPPAVPARSVLPTMALLDAARQSALEGRVVPITPLLPR